LPPKPVETLPKRLTSIRREIRKEYSNGDGRPWIVGFSGGKDSTLVLQLVFEAIQQCPPSERNRTVFVVSNDTLVESPVLQNFVDKVLEQLRVAVEALELPVEVHQTTPDPEASFWVNLLGKGYPAPNRNFRWCTDRMKIRPTMNFITERVQKDGEVVLLLGVRRAESAARARVIKRYSDGESIYNRHNDVMGCWVYRPIVELTTEEVWLALLSSQPPWGSSHRDLVTLYRNAQGGECPFVMSKEDSPSCGSSSPRFGCWTCTVVEKDRSLEALIDSGFEELFPLYEFRDRIKEVSATPKFRSKTRRDGRHGLGPLTIPARKMLLHELLEIQDEVGIPLISAEEVHLVESWWQQDEMTKAIRRVRAIEDQLSSGEE
jgi:DNA sulfur modification protein DndC